MKRTLFLISLVVICLASTSQAIYYDAIKLKNFGLGRQYFDSSDVIKLPESDSVFGVLKYYVPHSHSSNENLIRKDFLDNPFMKWDTSSIPMGITAPHGIASIFSSIGGLDITKYANAISEIMIERAKQELTIAFFDRFKKFVSEDNPEFQVLFPKTSSNLANLISFKYPQMLQALRNGFFEDLSQITYHLDDVLELPKYRNLLNNFPEVSLAIKSIGLVHNLETKNATAADIIKDFAALNDWAKPGSAGFKNMGNAIRFASIFSQSLRYKDSTRIWVSSEDIKSLITNDTLTKIYMGLIYQQVKNDSITFYLDPHNLSKVTRLTTIFAEQKEYIILFQNKVSEFIGLADKVMDSYGAVAKKKDGQKISNEDIYNYINVSLDVIDYAFSILKIFDEKLVADDYLTIAKKSNALYKDIYSEQYTQAINDAMDILKSVHDLSADSQQQALTPSVISEEKGDLGKLSTFIEKLRPYALFMANMIEAKDDKEVTAALENVILPVGSSSIKKNTQFNVSVQSYLGAYWSVSNSSIRSSGSWSDKFGVTAPIGISFTPGFSSWGQSGSVSLFTSLLDLGAIVDYKLTRDSTINNTGTTTSAISKDYTVKLGQIFSPGISIVYGFGWNLPLSLGFGGQYGPGLSKIDAGNTTVIANPSWRWNLFLAVDIPFFTLKNKMKDR